jgi:hypothetical protein
MDVITLLHNKQPVKRDMVASIEDELNNIIFTGVMVDF